MDHFLVRFMSGECQLSVEIFDSLDDARQFVMHNLVRTFEPGDSIEMHPCTKHGEVL